jgi:hypothetical protein
MNYLKHFADSTLEAIPELVLRHAGVD